MNEFIPLFGKFGQAISPLTQVSEPVLKYFMCQIIFVVRSFKSMRVKFTELSLIDISRLINFGDSTITFFNIFHLNPA